MLRDRRLRARRTADPPDGSLGRSLDLYAGHAEIPCGTWAGRKLSRYLMGFTGEARFGDWIETMLYNAIGAALPTEPEGRTYYYGDYRISSRVKQYYWHEWPCYSGTYIQTVADYHNIVCFHDERGLFVDLYVPFEVRWRGVTLRQETLFPESEMVRLRLTVDQPGAFTLRFRVPSRCTGMSIAVNGESVSAVVLPGGWACVERSWQTNDEVTLHLPMRLRLLPVDRQHSGRVAILCGPVVLAQDEACCRRPIALEDVAQLEKKLVCDTVPPRFNVLDTTPERHRRWLQPLHRFPGFWPYWVYFNLKAPSLY